jgi:hypothetical protein
MVGVQIGEIIEPGEGFVDRRVVFHGAGAEWIQALVQVEVHAAQPAKVARQILLRD